MVTLVSAIGCGTGESDLSPVPLRTARRIDSEAAEVGRWGGLKIHTAGIAIEDAPCVVIFLHGYGTPGTDLVPLGQELVIPGKTAFIFPEAPIALPEGGRAWCHLDGRGFNDSCARLKQLLSHLAATRPQCPIIIGGFSQGATIVSNLLDVSDYQTLRAAILYSPANRLQNPPPANQTHPIVLIAHGRKDPALPFSGAKALRDKFQQLGCNVTWVPFEGAHTIPAIAISRTKELIQSIASTTVGDNANQQHQR